MVGSCQIGSMLLKAACFVSLTCYLSGVINSLTQDMLLSGVSFMTPLKEFFKCRMLPSLNLQMHAFKEVTMLQVLTQKMLAEVTM